MDPAPLPAPSDAAPAPPPAALPLTPEEVRVLGALVEKELATPEYYPLTLNALVAACNQKSNRDPVTALDEKTVVHALDLLRERKLAWQVSQSGSRALKYRHDLPAAYGTSAAETAVLCELMLRGPQTIGELRTHASRLAPLPDLASAEAAVRGLVERGARALAAPLPREPGRREIRYAHLLAGPPAEAQPAAVQPPPVCPGTDERLSRLEADVAALRAQVRELARRVAIPEPTGTPPPPEN
jgi:hypothetical protein